MTTSLGYWGVRTVDDLLVWAEFEQVMLADAFSSIPRSDWNWVAQRGWQMVANAMMQALSVHVQMRRRNGEPGATANLRRFYEDA